MDIHSRAGRPVPAKPVKMLAAIIFNRAIDPCEVVFPAMEELVGEIDFQGEEHPFTMTDYYQDEMGSDLARIIISFNPLVSPSGLVEFKLRTDALEKDFSSSGSRRVNIDPGYMDFHKVVLASFKPGPQKIYLREGVYADPVLYYRHGGFSPLYWSFPDFASGLYNSELDRIRRLYRNTLRKDGYSSF
jgi:hypothetical protein